MKRNNTYIILFLFALNLSSFSLLAQRQICGKVTDCENRSLPGVNVFVDSISETTDIDGFYKITIPDTSAFINYSAIGMLSQRIKIEKQDTINVSLKEDKRFADSIIIVKKPVIYLYPQSEIEVSLRIDYKGKMLFSYPSYKEEGWNVMAYPNGKLIDKNDGKQYSYLFWDGEKVYKKQDTDYETGYVVHKDSVVSFLQNKLEKIGLQAHEYNEFVVFWTPYLIKNDWSFIHFRIGEAYEVISKNIVKPQPETIIRVFMDFKGLEKPFAVAPQEIGTSLRKGFTLVEWGGAELKQNIRVRVAGGEYIER